MLEEMLDPVSTLLPWTNETLIHPTALVDIFIDVCSSGHQAALFAAVVLMTFFGAFGVGKPLSSEQQDLGLRNLQVDDIVWTGEEVFLALNGSEKKKSSS